MNTSYTFGQSMDQEKDDNWEQIMNLEKGGNEKLEYESKAKRERIAIFDTAIEKLKKYIEKYIQDKQSREYLRGKFRLGKYYEYAGKQELALDCYRECERHPLKDIEKYNEKPIASQIKERLDSLIPPQHNPDYWPPTSGSVEIHIHANPP